jgi:hypothetical protein
VVAPTLFTIVISLDELLNRRKDAVVSFFEGYLPDRGGGSCWNYLEGLGRRMFYAERRRRKQGNNRIPLRFLLLINFTS